MIQPVNSLTCWRFGSVDKSTFPVEIEPVVTNVSTACIVELGVDKLGEAVGSILMWLGFLLGPIGNRRDGKTKVNAEIKTNIDAKMKTKRRLGVKNIFYSFRCVHDVAILKYKCWLGLGTYNETSMSAF